MPIRPALHLLPLSGVLLLAPAVATAAADVAPSPAPAPAAAPASSADAQFVAKAAQGGLAEVELGTLAQARSENEDVDAFAARMVADHGAANQKLAKIASDAGIALPQGLSAQHQALKAKLEKLEGDAFDEAYGKAMLEDHSADVALFEKQAAEGQIPAVRAFAAETLPTLKAHHELAAKLPGAQ